MSKNTPKPGEDPEEETSPSADFKQEPPVPLQDEKEVLNQNYWSEYQKLKKHTFDNSSSLLSIWAKRLLDIWCQQHHFLPYEFFMR